MANATKTYEASGSTKNFAVGLSSIKRADITVRVNGINAPFSWIDDGNVSLRTVPNAGSKVEIVRSTDISLPAVDFTDGSTFTAADLDNAVRQSLYSVQEVRDDMDYLTTWVQTNAGGVSTTDPGGGGTTTIVNALPPVTIANNDSVLVAEGGAWVVTPKESLKTVLGMDPNKASLGTAAYLNTGTGPGQIPTKDNLGSAAFKNVSNSVGDVPVNTQAAALGSAAYYNAGSSPNQLLVLGNDGAGHGIYPAISGAAITNVLHTLQYARLHLSRNYNGAHGGSVTANTPTTVPLNGIWQNEVGLSLNTSTGEVTLAPGDYIVEADVSVKGIGGAILRIDSKTTGAYSEMVRGTAVDSTGGKFVRLSAKVTIPVSTTIKLVVVGETTNATDGLGHTVNNSNLGAQYHATLVLYKFN